MGDGMSGDFQICENLYTYSDRIGRDVMMYLGQAASEIQAAADLINEPDVYVGQARDEIAEYLNSCAGHVDKITQFCRDAMKFIGNVTSTFDEYDRDEALRVVFGVESDG
jgi:hypothetical protein